MLDKLASFIVRFRKGILLMAFLLLIPAVYGAANLKVNYDLYSYLPRNLASVKGQKILDKKFGVSATAVVMVEKKDDWQVEVLKRKIEKIRGVSSVEWISDFADITIPREYQDKELLSQYFSDNATLLRVKLSYESTDPRTAKILKKIEKILGKGSYIVGSPAMVTGIQDITKKERPLMQLFAVAFVVAVLAFSLPSVVIPVVFLLVMGLAIIYNLAIPFYLGRSVSFITSSVTAALQLGVTMDYSIFLLHRFEEEKLKSVPEEAMVRAVARTAKAISSSSLTTIAGFLALTVMSLGFGADLGFTLARGVLISLVVVIAVLPSLILSLHKLIEKIKHPTFMPKFTKIGDFVIKRPYVLLFVFLILFVPAYYGYTHAKIEYDLEKSLPENAPFVKASEKVKEKFGSTETINLITKDVSEEKLAKIKEEIAEIDGVKRVVGYSDFVDPALPKEFIPAEVKGRFFAEGFTNTIITLKYPATDSRTKRTVREAKKVLSKYKGEIYLTGASVLSQDMMESAKKDADRVNFFSVLAVFLIVALAFTSFSIPIVLVAAIILAILINQSIAFYSGNPVFFFATMAMGAIQLGATVDYAILLTSRYEEELANHPRVSAMHLAIEESGRAIGTSALTLAGATFGLSLASSMKMVKGLSLLLARGALISFSVVVVLLPAVLLSLTSLIEKTSFRWPKSKK